MAVQMHALDGNHNQIEIMCRLQLAPQKEDDEIVFSADDGERRLLFGSGTSFSMRLIDDTSY